MDPAASHFPRLPDLSGCSLADPSAVSYCIELAGSYRNRVDRRYRLNVARAIVDHLTALGFLFLRKPYAGHGAPGSRRPHASLPEDLCRRYRIASKRETEDAAAYAVVFKASLDRREAERVVGDLMGHVRLQYEVLRDTTKQHEVPATLSELDTVEEERREKEARKWPTWDDW
jgi:hypothetical protein